MTGAPDEREPPGESDGDDPSARGPSDDADVSAAAGDVPPDATGPSSPREQLMARLGHAHDTPDQIDAYLTAQALFERGDNQRAGSELRALLEGRLSPELRDVATTLRRRIQPDRVALFLVAACVLGLVLIWFLAVRAS